MIIFMIVIIQKYININLGIVFQCQKMVNIKRLPQGLVFSKIGCGSLVIYIHQMTMEIHGDKMQVQEIRNGRLLQ